MGVKQIRTVSYVRKGEGLAEISGLPEEEKKRVAAWLKCTYLNTMFQGRAVFQDRGDFSQER